MEPVKLQNMFIFTSFPHKCDPLYRNQSEVATAHFKINVDLRKQIVFQGSGVLFDFKQSLGFQNMKLLFPKSHDKYMFEACKGKMTALTRHSAVLQRRFPSLR